MKYLLLLTIMVYIKEDIQTLKQKKANLEKLKEIKEKILLFKTNIKSKFSEKVLTKKLKKI